MKTFTLYGTDACHLCEQAEALIASAIAGECTVRVCVEDISDSAELLTRYGLRIPVLRDPSGRELDWPFSVGAVRRFLCA